MRQGVLKSSAVCSFGGRKLEGSQRRQRLEAPQTLMGVEELTHLHATQKVTFTPQNNCMHALRKPPAETDPRTPKFPKKGLRK
eukprot:4544822-Amphidinium_carterae.1